MLALVSSLRLVHIVSAVLWFGFGLGIPGDVKRTLALGPAHVPPLVERIDAQTKRVFVVGLLTVLSGLGLIFARGGFGAVAVRYHVGLALSIVILALGAAVMRPTWLKVKDAAQKGDLDGARALAKRMAAGSGVIQLLWTLVIVLMVYPFER